LGATILEDHWVLGTVEGLDEDAELTLVFAPPLDRHKLVVLGEAVGKTHMISRFVFGTIGTGIPGTIGIDFLSKTLYLEDRVLRLKIWDTVGQERFRSLIPSYIRDASGAIVVYDITKRNTFLGISEWIDHVRRERGEAAVIVLVGNKADQADQRQVSTAEGEEKARPVP
jgi:Ras-related protein Rab-6A